MGLEALRLLLFLSLSSWMAQSLLPRHTHISPDSWLICSQSFVSAAGRAVVVVLFPWPCHRYCQGATGCNCFVPYYPFIYAPHGGRTETVEYNANGHLLIAITFCLPTFRVCRINLWHVTVGTTTAYEAGLIVSGTHTCVHGCAGENAD